MLVGVLRDMLASCSDDAHIVIRIEKWSGGTWDMISHLEEVDEIGDYEVNLENDKVTFTVSTNI